MINIALLMSGDSWFYFNFLSWNVVPVNLQIKIQKFKYNDMTKAQQGWSKTPLSVCPGLIKHIQYRCMLFIVA